MHKKSLSPDTPPYTKFYRTPTKNATTIEPSSKYAIPEVRLAARLARCRIAGKIGEMVVGYHTIMSFYGFWLPNDPRGSWSTWIRQWELLRYGPATKVNTTQSVAGQPHDYALRQAAKQALEYPPVVLTDTQVHDLSEGLKSAIDEGGYRCFACAILPEHVHLVLGRHQRPIELQLQHLRANSTRELNSRGSNPLLSFKRADGYIPTPWAHGHWSVYLNNANDVQRAIQYVENNPLKEGKARQRWNFVKPYAPDMF